eukprot:7301321-Prymnesium_polylepis.1
MPSRHAGRPTPPPPTLLHAARDAVVRRARNRKAHRLHVLVAHRLAETVVQLRVDPATAWREADEHSVCLTRVAVRGRASGRAASERSDGVGVVVHA